MCVCMCVACLCVRPLLTPTLPYTNQWADKQRATFSEGKTGSTLLEIKALLDEFKDYERALAPHKELADSMTSEQEAITTEVAAVQAKLGEVVAAAAEYRSNLDAQQAHLQKMLDLNKTYNSKVKEWCPLPACLCECVRACIAQRLRYPLRAWCGCSATRLRLRWTKWRTS